MFISIETSDGATALINPAHITHVTPSDPGYAEDGSVIHFVSDRALKVKDEIASLGDLLSADLGALAGESPFLIRG
jgi:hypothetical protein